GKQRFLPAYVKMAHHLRKDCQSPERHHGQTSCLFAHESFSFDIKRQAQISLHPPSFFYALSLLTELCSKRGTPPPFTTSSVIRHAFSVSSDGALYMISIMTFSMIALKPLAPVFLLREVSAMASSASSSKVSSTPSSSSIFWYCLVIAFLGSVKIRIRASLSSISRDTTT